ncbi:MAG: bacteriohemerythrin [Desulfuromonadales bacterium]|jgi:hemerythrin|nr:bacteriohemerythrin [Desulfuromonadales bacterium]
MLFVWDDDYKTGIAEIDQDHKKLVNLINDLYEAMQDGSGGALLLPIFSALKHYTETHFAKEERYMIEHDAPGQAKHFQEHKMMVTKLADLESRHRHGEAAISLQTLTFLRDWLKNHICIVDQVMAAKLKDKHRA